MNILLLLVDQMRFDALSCLEREGDCDFWQIERWKTGRNFREGLKEHGIDFDAGVNEVQPLEWGGSAKFYGLEHLASDLE